MSLLFSIPASLGLIFASDEIVNALFGYGAFTYEDVKITSTALRYFGYGVPAFALVKTFKFLFCKKQYKDTILYFNIYCIIKCINKYFSF